MAVQQVLELEQGARGVWTITLSDSQGGSPSGLSGADSVSAAIWNGDDGAVLATPTCVWATAPTSLTLTITSTDTASLTAQPYPIRAYITHSGQVIPAWRGWLDLRSTPGSATAKPTYSTFSDMCLYAGDWIRKVMIETSESGFQTERARARTRLEEVILARYRPSAFMYRADLSLGGYGTNFAPEAPNPWLKTQLAANYLIVTNKVIEICSRLAIYYACTQSLGTPGKDNVYEAEGMRQKAEASRLFKSYVAEIDINSDGLPDLTINCGVLNVRSLR
jgi:hypothetical protein